MSILDNETVVRVKLDLHAHLKEDGSHISSYTGGKFEEVCSDILHYDEGYVTHEHVWRHKETGLLVQFQESTNSWDEYDSGEDYSDEDLSWAEIVEPREVTRIEYVVVA